MITVLFFAQLKERLNCSKLTLDVRQSMSVGMLQQQLAAQGDIWQASLQKGQVLVAVNQTLASPETVVNNEDEVAFFPPVTGG